MKIKLPFNIGKVIWSFRYDKSNVFLPSGLPIMKGFVPMISLNYVFFGS